MHAYIFGFDESSLSNDNSISPERNRLFVSGEVLAADALSSASTRSDQKSSPIHCKNLTARTPILSTQSETSRISVIDNQSHITEFASPDVQIRNKVNSAEYASMLTQRSRRSSSSPENSSTFLPAWRRKSMDKIQMLKFRREGTFRRLQSEGGAICNVICFSRNGGYGIPHSEHRPRNSGKLMTTGECRGMPVPQ
jgi:hypothetical protein